MLRPFLLRVRSAQLAAQSFRLPNRSLSFTGSDKPPIAVPSKSTAASMASSNSFDSTNTSTWHRSRVLPAPWSCDWSTWDNLHEYRNPDGCLSPKTMQEQWSVAGPIEPLAFVPEKVTGYHTLAIFCANGVYYWYSIGELRRYDGPFAGHDDFLRRLRDEEIWGGGSVVETVEDRLHGHSLKRYCKNTTPYLIRR